MPHVVQRPGRHGRARPRPAPRRKVVLVVEDYASVGGLVAGLIRQAGYRSVRAWDSQEALRLARGRRPDAVVLDLNLAYPAAPPILQDLRSSEALRHCPIILVAGAQVVLGDADRPLVDALVTKPFDIDVMLNEVRQAVGDDLVEIQPRQYDGQDSFLHGY